MFKILIVVILHLGLVYSAALDSALTTTDGSGDPDNKEETTEGGKAFFEGGSCGKADLVFVLDESNSISHDDIDKAKEFIAGVIGHLRVGPDANRIGMISFGETAGVRFDMTQFSDRKALQDHVLGLSRLTGKTTGTFHALRLLRNSLADKSFGARDRVAKIGVLITDGGSTIPRRTARQARLVHKAGIQVFAVGVAKDRQGLNETELKIIASDPDETFAFYVDDWVALQSIRQVIANRACEVATIPPPTEPPSEARKEEKVCERTDVIFAPSDSAGPIDLNYIAKFIKDIVATLDIDNGRFQVGVLPINCRRWDGFDLGDYPTKEHHIGKIEMWHFNVPDTAQMAGEMRFRFGAAEPANLTENGIVRRVGVFFVDHKSVDFEKTIEHARKAHDEGVEVYVFAVGKHFNNIEVSSLASLKLSDHVFRVTDYSMLSLLSDKFSALLHECPRECQKWIREKVCKCKCETCNCKCKKSHKCTCKMTNKKCTYN